MKRSTFENYRPTKAAIDYVNSVLRRNSHSDDHGGEHKHHGGNRNGTGSETPSARTGEERG